MNLAIDLRNVAVPHGLDLLTRSWSSRHCSPHRLDLPTRSWSSRRCSPYGPHVLRGSTSLRARSPSRRYIPHGPHVPRGSTSLRARSPHGAVALISPTSLGARPPCALAVLTALQSSWAPRPYGLPRLGTTFALALQDHVNPRDLESHRSKYPTE